MTDGQHEAPAKKSFELTDSTYDFFRAVVQYLLPGLGTFYFALASIWGLPYAEEVVGTLAALAVLCGIILALSRRAYNANHSGTDGTLLVDDSDPLTDKYTLAVDTPLEAVQSKGTLTLQVVKAPLTPLDEDSQ